MYLIFGFVVVFIYTLASESLIVVFGVIISDKKIHLS